MPTEIDGAEEAGVEQGHLKSPGPLKENCLGPHLQEGQCASRPLNSVALYL